MDDGNGNGNGMGTVRYENPSGKKKRMRQDSPFARQKGTSMTLGMATTTIN